MSRLIAGAVLALTLTLAGCGLNDTTEPGGGTGTGTDPDPGGLGTGPGSAGWSTDPRQATDPDGKSSPLKDAKSDTEVDEALKFAGEAISEYRKKGVDRMVQQLKTDVPTVAGPVGGITDDSVGQPLPSALNPDGSPQAYPPAPEYAKFFVCPILAPEVTTDDSCDKLIVDTVKKVTAAIEQDRGDVTKTIEAKLGTGFSKDSITFVVAWAMEAYHYGAKVASIYASEELRADGKCDQHLSGMKIAFVLGKEQGQHIVLGHKPWAVAQAQACIMNTDAIAVQVKTMSLGEVDTFLQAHPLCKDNDVSKVNQVLMQAEVQHKDGIEVGIGNQVEVLRKELVMINTASCRRTGDPLVIDLDGDGLQLGGAVRFDLLADGHPQRVAWVGAREGLLALDLDGDGRISSGEELFSDRARCGSARCADGVAALAAWDEPARGGNGDGLIDARDAVFAQLLLWVDANGDGASQPGELASLAARGVASMGLHAAASLEERASGVIGSRLEVLTDRGFCSAYEVGFQLGLTSANLTALLPGTR